jgi:hypothetical protein
MLLLKIEAKVLPAICSLELLVAESFLEVDYRNLFGTTPSLIQFKYALVSNSAIVLV